ncbi:hypothetical protein TrVFT333_011165 [Trichoderma virens FT-333]|nr:hypothetical protein TrVFT333_011165 [Trichoderma virens FT-333]
MSGATFPFSQVGSAADAAAAAANANASVPNQGLLGRSGKLTNEERPTAIIPGSGRKGLGNAVHAGSKYWVHPVDATGGSSQQDYSIPDAVLPTYLALGKYSITARICNAMRPRPHITHASMRASSLEKPIGRFSEAAGCTSKPA